MFALGVGGFGVTSLLCAIAPSIGTLIAFRALHGIAGALLTPSSPAVVIATFPAKERGPAIGTWTAWGTIAGALGPLIAGLILNVASWRWIYRTGSSRLVEPGGLWALFFFLTLYLQQVAGYICGRVIGAVGIRNPRRAVEAKQCSGGRLAGAPLDAAGVHALAPA